MNTVNLQISDHTHKTSLLYPITFKSIFYKIMIEMSDVLVLVPEVKGIYIYSSSIYITLIWTCNNTQLSFRKI